MTEAKVVAVCGVESAELPTSEYLYLDTQQWNFLVRHSSYSETQLNEFRNALREKVRNGGLVIVASIPLLEEVMGALTRRPEKYEAMKDLMFDVVQHRWLLPVNERYPTELTYKGLIPESSRFLSREIRRGVREMADEKTDLRPVINEIRSQTQNFKVEQEQIKKAVKAKLQAAGDKEENWSERLNKWWANSDPDDWTNDAVLPDVRARIDLAKGSIRELCPSAWHLMVFKMARIKLNLGDDETVKPSDYMDSEHYAASVYADLLITDDRKFAETCQLINAHPKFGNRPFRVENFNYLVAKLAA